MLDPKGCLGACVFESVLGHVKASSHRNSSKHTRFRSAGPKKACNMSKLCGVSWSVDHKKRIWNQQAFQNLAMSAWASIQAQNSLNFAQFGAILCWKYRVEVGWNDHCQVTVQSLYPGKVIWIETLHHLRENVLEYIYIYRDRLVDTGWTLWNKLFHIYIYI